MVLSVCIKDMDKTLENKVYLVTLSCDSFDLVTQDSSKHGDLSYFSA